MKEFVRNLPKAELHLHVEGTLEPGMMMALAERNRVAIRYRSVEEARAAYRFGDLQSFLDVYYEAMAVLRTDEDFFDLARAYLRRAASEKVLHAEIFFDPQAHVVRGVAFEAVLGGIHRAIEEGRRDLGIDASLILCFLRHLSEAEALETLEKALPFRDRLVGVGLDSGEAGNPPSKFVRVFERARKEGLRVVAHAGEEGPPAYVREALDLLGAERIDHGVRAVEDPELLRRLADARIPLTVCPLSNVCLRVVPRMEEHPLRRLMEAGVAVTINSDDPAYFGGYVSDNYLAAAEALGLSREDLVGLAANGFRASFVDDRRKREYLAALEAYAGPVS